MEKISGIYKIINKTNGKYYIGSSSNIIHRWIEHKCYLRKNKHVNNYLQNSWNKYGEDNFEFVIIEKVPKEKLIEVEQKYLDEIKNLPNKKNKYYNISIDSSCPGRGIKHTDEYKKKMSESCRGKKKPPFSREHCENMSKVRMGKIKWPNGRVFSEEHKKNMSKSFTGKRQGSKNNAFDNKIYSFKNLKTNETFTGTRFDFYIKFGLKNQMGHLSQLINGKRNHVKFWILNPNTFLTSFIDSNGRIILGFPLGDSEKPLLRRSISALDRQRVS